MTTQDRVKIFLGFSWELSQIDLMSRKDTFDNLQYFLERRLGIDYLASCDLAVLTRDYIFSVRGTDIVSKDFMLGLVEKIAKKNKVA